MIAFRLEEFFAPLNALALAMAVVLGLSLGVVLTATHHKLTSAALFWQLAGGIIFFVPLSILRATQGSTAWERFLATLILWMLFILGIWIGTKVALRQK